LEILSRKKVRFNTINDGLGSFQRTARNVVILGQPKGLLPFVPVQMVRTRRAEFLAKSVRNRTLAKASRPSIEAAAIVQRKIRNLLLSRRVEKTRHHPRFFSIGG
jgi:hypothetical protein